MANGQREIGEAMRPNIQISHQLNGRVKDYAAKHGLTTEEAYKRVIKEGLEGLEENGEE